MVHLTAEVCKLLRELASRMGFTYQGDLTEGCTHLVADTVRSQKYQMAIRLRIPVVSLAWITDSADRGELLKEDSYLLRPLHNLRIASSGFPPAVRRLCSGRSR